MSRQTVLMCKWQRDVVDTLLQLGYTIHLVLDDFDVQVERPDERLLEMCAKVYRVDSFDSHEQLTGIAADLIVNGVRPDLIFAHTEFSQLAAGYLETLLGRPRDRLRHAALRDKRLMKTVVAREGVPVASWRSVVDPTDTALIADVRARLRFPVVVKPAFGVGTTSTRRVASPEEFGRVMEHYTFDPVLRSRQLIVEEFITGRELHVDALWLGGQAQFFLISAYHQTRLSLLDSDEAANDRVALDGSYVILPGKARELYRRVADLHARVNGSLDISNAVTHLEAFETTDGELIFSEVAARMGGGWIPHVLSEYLGGNAWAVVASALATGQAPRWPEPTVHLGGLNLRPAVSGHITELPDNESVMATPGLRAYVPVRSVGDLVTLRQGADWCAHVVLTAESEPEYLALANAFARRHRVLTA
ncbi:ATP-grasp domain-containing protein [Nonomuraea sp. NPDC050643]|uniref:ATP-grasp domain-containing protein n=1 Tax=Nonomuraea sp. NPDC050643 TaxID=3155660 RepID=UPI0033CC69DA